MCRINFFFPHCKSIINLPYLKHGEKLTALILKQVKFTDRVLNKCESDNLFCRQNINDDLITLIIDSHHKITNTVSPSQLGKILHALLSKYKPESQESQNAQRSSIYNEFIITLASILIENNADINSHKKSNTILMIAVQQRCVPILILLLNKGVDVDQTIKLYEFTAFMRAAYLGYLDIAKELVHEKLTVKADINKKKIRASPLIFAITEKHSNVVQFLLKLGVDISNDSLELAVERSSIDIIIKLIQAHTFDIPTDNEEAKLVKQTHLKNALQIAQKRYIAQHFPENLKIFKILLTLKLYIDHKNYSETTRFNFKEWISTQSKEYEILQLKALK